MKGGSRVTSVAAGLTMLVGSTLVMPAYAADRVSMRSTAELPAGVAQMRLEEPLAAAVDRSVIDAALERADGRQQVLVRLRTPSVAR